MADRRRGRLPLNGEPATTVIKVRVTAAQRLELRRVADENGTGISGIIREAVSEFCSDYREGRSPFQRGHKIGTRPHTTDMANDPNPAPHPPQPPSPSGPSQPQTPNTPDTGTNLPKT